MTKVEEVARAIALNSAASRGYHLVNHQGVPTPEMVEAGARAAYHNYTGLDQPEEAWMDDEDREQRARDIAEWPEGVGTHIGVEGFRRCALACLTAALNVGATEALAQTDSALHVEE